LRLSLRSFCSSSVSPEPSATSEPAIGSTLNAIGPGNATDAGNGTADPSKTSSAARSATLRTCSSSSAVAAVPAPEAAW
jgi:hypothetical protein